MKFRSLILVFVCLAVANAQSANDSLEVPEPADTTEATSILLERVTAELIEVEAQIAREEERLGLIMTLSPLNSRITKVR